MQISKNFYFVLILHLILGKVTKFPMEKLSTSEVISKRPHGGEGGKHPPVPLGLKLWLKEDVNDLHKEPVKLIKLVKIPYSFLQSVSDQFHVIILSLPT